MNEIRTSNKSDVVLLTLDENAGLAQLTLNRPHCLNAINIELLSALVSCLKIVQTSTCKACIISGAGASFCSGEDLKETLAPRSDGRDAAELRLAFEQLQDITRLMTTCNSIFIAAVRGWAVGGGAEIALAADFVIASPDATFKFPEIIHGHAPTGGITGRLPQLVGLQHAKRMLLLGENIPAERALSLGMIAEVVEEPLARAMEISEQLTSRSTRTLASIKKVLESATFPESEKCLSAEVEAASWCFADEGAGNAFEKFRSRKSKGNSPTGRSESDEVPQLNLVSHLLRAAYMHPEKAFLRFGAVDITYSKFAKDVSYLANGLVNSGVAAGDVISAMMVNSEIMVRLWFAAMWIGAIWAPLHTEFRGLILHRAIELIRPKIMIVDASFLRYLPSDMPLQLYVREPAPGNKLTPWTALIGTIQSSPIELSLMSTATLLFTSGTTGPSKACELSHSYFNSVSRSLINSLQLTSNDVLFCPFPLCHADATSLTVIPALLLCTTAAISERFSARRWWDEIRQTRSTVADFMGATLSILFKAPPTARDADNTLRIMWGVPVPAWVEQFEERFALNVYEVYGSTETGLPVVQDINRLRVKGSCGVALEGASLKIVNEAGEEVDRGTVGELLVLQAAGKRFTGYYKDIESTSKSVQDGWFLTGDLCRLDSEGNLFFIGRRKHVIRRRGENISAFEVEEALLMHPGILECAAFGVPSTLSEEDVKVSVVKQPDSRISEHDVYDFAVKTMAKFQIPRYIEFVQGLPRTPTGKLEIVKLQDAWARGERGTTMDFEGTERK